MGAADWMAPIGGRLGSQFFDSITTFCEKILASFILLLVRTQYLGECFSSGKQ